MEVPDILIDSGDKANSFMGAQNKIASISREFAHIWWIKSKKVERRASDLQSPSLHLLLKEIPGMSLIIRCFNLQLLLVAESRLDKLVFGWRILMHVDVLIRTHLCRVVV